MYAYALSTSLLVRLFALHHVSVAAGATITKRLSQLNPDTVDDLLFLHGLTEDDAFASFSRPRLNCHFNFLVYRTNFCKVQSVTANVKFLFAYKCMLRDT